MKHLADRAGVELPQIEYSKEVREKATGARRASGDQQAGRAVFLLSAPYREGAQGYQYLTGRGLSEETMRKFGLGYSDKFGGGLYQFLKSKGYGDDRLRDPGFLMWTSVMGCMISSGTV